MPDPPRAPAEPGGVLILTAATGGGHDSVAAALREALRELAPGAGVRILDPLAGRPCHGLLSPARWYDATVARAPWLWGLFYRATDNPWAVRLGLAAAAPPWVRRLRATIRAGRPGLVVAVHPLCARLAAAVLRAVPDAPPLHCVVTDLATIHRCWAADGVAAFYAATPEARSALVAMGVPPERVRVTGLPVRASFARAPRPPAGDATPRVLVLGGGCPSRRVEQVARALAASRRPLRLVVVCGRNARLRRRLARAVGARATVLGWRDDIAALMRWSSVVVTRGGPTTLAEALSLSRPVVIYQALRGQEVGNVALAERTGAGRYIPDVDALVRAVAAGPCALPADDAPHAAWWGGAARRVAACLLAARAEALSRGTAYRFAPTLEYAQPADK
ncbi:MAG TPA: glycosyltransferase [Thermomicrobiales bacterium]|nr:glycosyltransferase [Thermomicrobiales bacterium]